MSPTNHAQQTPWRWITLLFIVQLVRAHSIAVSQEPTYLECGGPNVTVPYCLQCAEGCLLECGGPDVEVPWCHPCRDECVTPPGNPRKLLGEDGQPFIVDMWEMGTIEPAKDKTMSWAASAKWKKAPKMTMMQSAAICWAFKSDVCGGDLTYQCVNLGL